MGKMIMRPIVVRNKHGTVYIGWLDNMDTETINRLVAAEKEYYELHFDEIFSDMKVPQ